jgi:hypothetical protein
MSDMTAKILDLRQRAARNEEVTIEELREAVQYIRVNRTAVQLAATAKKAVKTPLSDEGVMDLFK